MKAMTMYHVFNKQKRLLLKESVFVVEISSVNMHK